MTTSIGSVATTSIVCKGFRHAHFVQGDINTAGGPGQAYCRTAVNNVFTIATTAHTLNRLYFLEFRHRTSSTFGEVDIDTDDSTTADCILLDITQSGDDLEWWARVADMSADKFAGVPLQAHSDGFLALADGAAMSSGTIQARVATNYRYVNGDTVVKCMKP